MTGELAKAAEIEEKSCLGKIGAPWVGFALCGFLSEGLPKIMYKCGEKQRRTDSRNAANSKQIQRKLCLCTERANYQNPKNEEEIL